jgi:hypothetical protein
MVPPTMLAVPPPIMVAATSAPTIMMTMAVVCKRDQSLVPRTASGLAIGIAEAGNVAMDKLPTAITSIRSFILDLACNRESAITDKTLSPRKFPHCLVRFRRNGSAYAHIDPKSHGRF